MVKVEQTEILRRRGRMRGRTRWQFHSSFLLIHRSSGQFLREQEVPLHCPMRRQRLLDGGGGVRLEVCKIVTSACV